MQIDFMAMVERNLTFQNPTSEAKLDLLIDYCGIADGQRVLDVGCGRAWLLRRMAATRAIEGVGVEKRAVFKKEADAAHALQRSAGAPGSVTVHCMPAAEFDAPPASFDVALCVGAAFAIGTFEAMLEWLRPLVKPGGIIAVGDIYALKEDLPAETARHFGGGALRGFADTVDAMNADGLALVGVIDSSLDDWDRYESAHWRAAVSWLREHRDHPDYDEVLTQHRAFMRNHLRFDRESLGWALFVSEVSAT